MANSSSRLEPLVSPTPQILNGNVPVNQFSSLRLAGTLFRSAQRAACVLRPSNSEIPIAPAESQNLIEHLTRLAIRAGLHRQVDHSLLFGFQINAHALALIA
jgi:hypothetical protein